MRPGKRRQLDRRQRRGAAGEGEGVDPREVGAPVLYVKRVFGYAKVELPGPHKNRQRIALLLGLANLLIAERSLAA